MRLETTPWAPKILVLRVQPEKKKWNFSPLASTYAFRCPRTSRKFKKCLVSSYSCRNVQTMARLPRAQREPATLKSITRQAQMEREGGAGDHTAYLTHLQVRVPLLPQTVSGTSKLYVQSSHQSLDPPAKSPLN